MSSPPEDALPVEQDAQPHADHQNVAQHVQFLAVGQRADVGEEPLKQADEYRAAGCWCRPFWPPNSRPQVKKPMMSSTTFKIIVMADSDSGTKLDSTMPKPEMLLTDAWLGTRKK